MSMFKLFFAVLLILAAAPALGYARYLHDDEDNTGGALMILALVVLTGAALWQGRF